MWQTNLLDDREFQSESSPSCRIFAAWTDPRELLRWLASSAKSDARMCGHFRLEATDSDNRRCVVTGEYKEFVPDRRLVMTWVYEGPLVATGVIETQLRIELSALLANYTELSLRHEGLSDAEYRRYIHQGVWTDVPSS